MTFGYSIQAYTSQGRAAAVPVAPDGADAGDRRRQQTVGPHTASPPRDSAPGSPQKLGTLCFKVRGLQAEISGMRDLAQPQDAIWTQFSMEHRSPCTSDWTTGIGSDGAAPGGRQEAAPEAQTGSVPDAST